MKARVQYNDYRGTSVGVRSDYLESHGGQMTEIIINTFQIPVEADDYEYVGVSVYGTEVEDVCATFFFRNKETKEVVKYFKSSFAMQSVSNLCNQLLRAGTSIGANNAELRAQLVRRILKVKVI